ncbi:hypothetical protein WN48_04470 [Eufriesea mexicana]|nr:hypothetical protein WN48_04470 [Eufriesea mexicana]
MRQALITTIFGDVGVGIRKRVHVGNRRVMNKRRLTLELPIFNGCLSITCTDYSNFSDTMNMSEYIDYSSFLTLYRPVAYQHPMPFSPVSKSQIFPGTGSVSAYK